MKLVLFATLEEARATLDLLHAHPEKEGELYSFSSGLIVICGMGILAACHAVAHYQASAKEIWNFGIAGTLDHTIAIGTFLPVSVVTKNLSFPPHIDDYSTDFSKRVYPPLSLQSVGVKLISSAYPIHDPQLRKDLAKNGTLIDMEGYGIAYAAQKSGKRCVMWKMVSDYADGKSCETIMKKLPSFSKQIAQAIARITRLTKLNSIEYNEF